MLNLEISIPNEFVDNFYEDKFSDALHRLSADAHLIAGNYEQEVAKMLWMALKEARPVYPKPTCEVCENLEDGDVLYQSADYYGGVCYEYIHDVHYCPRCGRKLKHG